MTCKVLVVGDALIDIFLFINTASEHCHVDEKTCEICFTLGAKIPVDDAHFLLGGNACNVAVGLSRLGVRAALITELGSDEFGKKIIAGLRKEHVNLKFLKQTPGSQTSFSVDLITAKDRTIL